MTTTFDEGGRGNGRRTEKQRCLPESIVTKLLFGNKNCSLGNNSLIICEKGLTHGSDKNSYQTKQTREGFTDERESGGKKISESKKIIKLLKHKATGKQ